MAGEKAPGGDIEVYCMICNKPLGEDDDIHFIFGSFGFDLDIMCGTCMERSKQQPAGESLSIAGLGGLGLGIEGALGLGRNGDPFDDLTGMDAGDTAET